MAVSNQEVGLAISRLREACTVVNAAVKAVREVGCGVHLNLNHKGADYLPEVSMLVALAPEHTKGA